jgi:hypothetical protein
MAHEVFISHASEQEALAFQLVERFEADGVRCWIAARNIPGGAIWADAIMAALTSSRLVLALLSENANTSEYVLGEVTQAREAGIPILPVRVEKVLPSPPMKLLLGHTHWVNAFDRPPDKYYDELTATVRTLLSGGAVTGPTTTSGLLPLPAVQASTAGETADTVDLHSLQVEVDLQTEPPLAGQVGGYDVPMNSQRPGCLILLVDQSGSMNRRIAGTTIPKREFVADAVNGLLYEAVLRATGDEGVRHRFDIGVLGYGAGEEDVQSVFGKDLAPINEIARMAKPPKIRVVHQPDGQGGMVELEIELPSWFEPIAKGQTMMYAAFERALTATKRWVREHPSSFPPIVINITDGGFTRKDPTPLVREIRELTTQAGNALVFNCHISETEGAVVRYPGPSTAASFEKRMRQLYEMSSVLPELMRERALERGYDVEPGARGYVLHADAAGLIEFLEIGGTRAMDI